MTATKTALDCGAAALAFASFLEWLPSVAAALSIVWLAIRIYEYARWIWRGRKGRTP